MPTSVFVFQARNQVGHSIQIVFANIDTVPNQFLLLIVHDTSRQLLLFIINRRSSTLLRLPLFEASYMFNTCSPQSTCRHAPTSSNRCRHIYILPAFTFAGLRDNYSVAAIIGLEERRRTKATLHTTRAAGPFLPATSACGGRGFAARPGSQEL